MVWLRPEPAITLEVVARCQGRPVQKGGWAQRRGCPKVSWVALWLVYVCLCMVGVGEASFVTDGVHVQCKKDISVGYFFNREGGDQFPCFQGAWRFCPNGVNDCEHDGTATVFQEGGECAHKAYFMPQLKDGDETYESDSHDFWCPVQGAYDTNYSYKMYWMYCNCKRAAFVPALLGEPDREGGGAMLQTTNTSTQVAPMKDFWAKSFENTTESGMNLVIANEKVDCLTSFTYNGTLFEDEFNNCIPSTEFAKAKVFSSLKQEVDGWCPTELAEDGSFLNGGPCSYTWDERIRTPPTPAPTPVPTTATPTKAPTPPTNAPTASPSKRPTTMAPSMAPTVATEKPTMAPTISLYNSIDTVSIVSIPEAIARQLMEASPSFLNSVQEDLLRSVRCMMRRLMFNTTIQHSFYNVSVNSSLEVAYDLRAKNPTKDVDGSILVPSLEVTKCVSVAGSDINVPVQYPETQTLCEIRFMLVQNSLLSIYDLPTPTPVVGPGGTTAPGGPTVQPLVGAPPENTRAPTSGAPTPHPTQKPTKETQVSLQKYLIDLYTDQESPLYAPRLMGESFFMSCEWIISKEFKEIFNSSCVDKSQTGTLFKSSVTTIPTRDDIENPDNRCPDMDGATISAPPTTLAPTSQPTTPEKDSHLGLILGVSLGFLFTVILSLMACTLLEWRKKKKKDQIEEKKLTGSYPSNMPGHLGSKKASTISTYGSTLGSDGHPAEVFRVLHSRFSSSDATSSRSDSRSDSVYPQTDDGSVQFDSMNGLQIELSKLILGPVIGHGGNGRIFKASYCGSEVAVKELFPRASCSKSSTTSQGNLSRKVSHGSFTSDTDIELALDTKASAYASSSNTVHDVTRGLGPRRRSSRSISSAVSDRTMDSENEEELCFEGNDTSGDILQEVRTLRRLRHPNIIQLYGCSTALSTDTGGWRFLVVMELAACSLLDLIMKSPKSQNLSFTELDLDRKLFIARQIAAGCAYIHDNSLIHFDIKPENILLDASGNAKICDLGIAKSITGLDCKIDAAPYGTPAYMAPELLSEGKVVGTKVDVYSYGLVLWQIMYCKPPHPRNWTVPKLFYEVRYNKYRPKFYADIQVDPLVIEMISRCWDEDPQVRPGFHQLIQKLDVLIGSRKVHADVLTLHTFHRGDSVGVWDYGERRYIPATILEILPGDEGAVIKLKADSEIRRGVPLVEIVPQSKQQATGLMGGHSISGLALQHAGMQALRRTAARSPGLPRLSPIDLQFVSEENTADPSSMEPSGLVASEEGADLNKTYNFGNGILELQDFKLTESGVQDSLTSATGGEENAKNSSGATKDMLFRYCDLGKGASGSVYGAFHLTTFRLVAVKEIRFTDRSSRHQAVRELKALFRNLRLGADEEHGESKCPQIVSLYDAFLDPQTQSVNLIMEYMNGGSLQDFVDRLRCEHQQSTMPIRASSNEEGGSFASSASESTSVHDVGFNLGPQVVSTGICIETTLALIARHVLKAIAFLHENHYVHLDIKPANVLLNSKGLVKLADFGLAKQLESSGEQFASTFVGTMKYMSPERLRGGKYSYPSDIWSFGLTMLTTTLGHYPMDFLTNKTNEQVESEEKEEQGRRLSKSCPSGEGEDEYTTKQGGATYWRLLERWDSGVPVHLPQQVLHKSAVNGGKTDHETIAFSADYQDFIAQCLILDPKKRPSAKQLLKHPFVQKYETITDFHQDSQVAVANAEYCRGLLQDITFSVMSKVSTSSPVRNILEFTETESGRASIKLNEGKIATLSEELLLPKDVVKKSFLVAANATANLVK